MPLAALDQPLKMADELSCVEAANICQSAYESLARSETMAARIRKTLHERRREFPTLNELADSLHLTPRTLHRRLLDEGTSYNEILEEVRHVLAVEYLKAGQLDMQEIAYELGYSDLSNFRPRLQALGGCFALRLAGKQLSPSGSEPLGVSADIRTRPLP